MVEAENPQPKSKEDVLGDITPIGAPSNYQVSNMPTELVPQNDPNVPSAATAAEG